MSARPTQNESRLTLIFQFFNRQIIINGIERFTKVKEKTKLFGWHVKLYFQNYLSDYQNCTTSS